MAPRLPKPSPVTVIGSDTTSEAVLPVTESGMLSTASSRVPPLLTVVPFASVPRALESSISRMPAAMMVAPV